MTYWDQVARDFDSLYDPDRRVAYLLNQFFRRGLFQRTEIACEVIRQVGAPSILDVGCGSGRNISSFLESGAREVTGIDSAHEMLELARQISLPWRDRVRFLEADFLSASIEESFDVVVALGVFDYLHEEAATFLRKMRRLASRAVVLSLPGRSLLRMPLRAWRYRRSGVNVHFYPFNEIADLCQQAGFASFAIRRVHSSGYVVVGWIK